MFVISIQGRRYATQSGGPRIYWSLAICGIPLFALMT